ncbi:MAG: cupin domain-containing protein [Xanthomonadales bacterium]|nr:cupin domain-containing protein [Xanthomonadales bacterium]
MRFDSASLTTERFLADFWQRRPLLVRQAFPGFEPALDADDLAGLACEELAEARLVTGSFPEHDWSVRFGPFSETDFAALPESGWTLLVQDVEKHYPPLRALMDEFRFLPAWRIDDLMVSVAGAGGSVGPHVDQYDVFLLQAAGQRRWEIATEYDPECLEHEDLSVLQSFSPEQSWVLEPGDVLYLPPGVAHHGIALGPGMTWSIGMRAPSRADLHLALGEWLSREDPANERYRDPDLRPPENPAEIGREAVQRFRRLARSFADDEDGFEVFVGAFLSRYRLAHEPARPPGRSEAAEIERALAEGQILRQNPWTRLLWSRAAGGARVFAAGAEFRCSVRTARTICDSGRLAQLTELPAGADGALLCKLVDEGHLYLESR